MRFCGATRNGDRVVSLLHFAQCERACGLWSVSGLQDSQITQLRPFPFRPVRSRRAVDSRAHRPLGPVAKADQARFPRARDGNARHERFAQALAEGHSATRAYERAGYKANAGNAVRLKANDKVAGRVAEIQARAAARAEISKSDVLRMLQEDRADAREAGQFSAAIRAAELLGKELGMFVDRRKLDIATDVAELSDAELSAIVASGTH